MTASGRFQRPTAFSGMVSKMDGFFLLLIDDFSCFPMNIGHNCEIIEDNGSESIIIKISKQGKSL